MTKVIWKFEISIEGKQVLMMPEGAKILDVQMQNESCCLWALCNPEAEAYPRIILIYGTGHKIIDEPGEFIATFQICNGDLVFHVFERKLK